MTASVRNFFFFYIFDPAAGSVLHLSWSRNKRRYSAEIEYSVVDLEHQLDAKVVINDVEYKATVRASDRDTKSFVVDVFAGKHYQLEAEVRGLKLYSCRFGK